MSSALAALSVGALLWSLGTGTFSLAYVARTTTRQTPWQFRLAALWGGAEGSLLMWTWLVSLAWTAVALTAIRRHRPLPGAVVACGGAVCFALMTLVAIGASPFAKLAVPALDGSGLPPILERPSMLFHPPLLYAGEAVLVVPFALGLAALVSGEIDRLWWRWARSATIVGWTLITAALLAGSRWSYSELGWGGFWAWDPVEDGGLLVWLAATVFIHLGIRAHSRSRPLSALGAGGAAAAPWIVALGATSLTRSGALSSVHSFALDATVGWTLLGICASAAGVTAILLARRARLGSVGDPDVLPGGEAAEFGIEPRVEGLLLGGQLLLGLEGMVVALGLVYAFVARLVGTRLEVTGRYFTRMSAPLAVLILVALAMATILSCPLTPTRRRRALLVGGVVAAVGGLTTALTIPATGGLISELMVGALAAACLFSLAMSTVGASSAHRRTARQFGGTVAHAGFAVLLLGAIGSSYGTAMTITLRPGETTVVGPWVLRYSAPIVTSTGRFGRVGVPILVTWHGHTVGRVQPGRRVYPGEGGLADVSVSTAGLEDLVVAVDRIEPSTGGVVAETYRRPLMILVWWGGLMMVAGGILAGVRPRRTGLPATDLPATATPDDADLMVAAQGGPQ